MTDLFTPPDQGDSILRTELTAKWKEKFPDAPPELLETKVESDLYIKTLERQKDEMRNDLIAKDKEIQARESMDALIDRLNTREPPQAPTLKPEEKPTTPDLKDFESLFERKYQEKVLSDIENKNFSAVQDKLRERFGNNSGAVLQEQAQALGLTKDDINSLAKKSPDAFFRMLGLNDNNKDTFMAPPRSDQRNDQYAPRTTVRDWNYYQSLKAKSPNEYWAPKTQLQMHRDADALGEKFGID